MKEIKLTKGYIALVDDSDFEIVNQYKWSYGNGYAVRAVKTRNGKWTTISLHKFLTGFRMTDHKNRNKLDNRRCNLRECTLSQNAHNRGQQKNNTSGHKGVYFHKKENKWMTAIGINGKLKHLGYFKTKAQAIKCYNNAVKLFHKDFAHI
jgi:hypothetical protein